MCDEAADRRSSAAAGVKGRGAMGHPAGAASCFATALATTAAVLALSVVYGPRASAQARPPTASIARPHGDSFDSAVRRRLAERFAAMLENRYAHADIGAKMAAAVRGKLRSGGYDAIASPVEFARALQDTAHTIDDDRHLRVSYGLPPMRRMEGTAPPREVIVEMRKENGALAQAQILDGNIGYLVVNGVPALEFSKAAIAAAFAFLHNTDALIIDLRGNGGGSPGTVAFYMSYLIGGAPRVVNTIHNRIGNHVDVFKTTNLGALSYGPKKPVFVLTSHWTFSGGEELAYDIQSLKRGLVIGETTGGGANPGGFFPLGQGFTVFLPVGYAVNPVTGTNWEGRGVQPNVPTPAGRALTKAKLLAVDQLQRTARSPIDIARLKAAKLEFEAEADYDAGRASPPAAAQIVGRYGQAGLPGGLMIGKKNDGLYLELPDRPDTRLISAGGGHYRLLGLPETFGMTFMAESGTVTLVVNLPGRGLAVLRKE
jgi:hypothetical protein